MSELRVDNIVSADGNTSPVYSQGVRVAAGKTFTNSGDFTTSGTTTISGPVTFGSGAEITGVTTFKSDLNNVRISGVTTFADGAYISGLTTFTSGVSGLSIVGPTTFTEGAVATGVVTFTGLSITAGTVAHTGGITVGGASTFSNAGEFTGNLTVGGNISCAGTITYEDVTSVDSVGIITARTDLKILRNLSTEGISTFIGAVNVDSGITGNLTGDVTGDVTGTADLASGLTGTPNITVGFTTISGLDSNTQLREKVNIVAGKLSANQTINIDNGMVHYFTTTETTTAVPNIMSTVGINTQMATGDTIAITLVTTAAAAAYCANIQVDGAAVTENWIGGSAPSSGGSSGVDIHSFSIIKTASATFTVIGNQSTTS